jgi:hypothetical protein
MKYRIIGVVHTAGDESVRRGKSTNSASVLARLRAAAEGAHMTTMPQLAAAVAFSVSFVVLWGALAMVLL